MSHFHTLGIEPAFDLDIPALEAAYFREQRAWHPDRFVGRSAQERVAASQHSADLNQAYETLKNPLKRAQHLLALEGIRVGTDNDTVKPSPEVLAEAMELRENPPPPAELSALIDESLKRLSAYFAKKQFDSMAQEMLRLSYLSKASRERRYA